MLFFLIFGAAIWEFSRLNVISQGTRDAVQSAITDVCTSNTGNVYDGVREGYSGGYKLENMSWTENVDTAGIMTKVDSELGTSGGIKTTDGKMEYSISDLSVNMENASLAPTDTDTGQLSGTATYSLTVPLSFGLVSLPPLTIQMKATSGYSQQGDAEFNGFTGGGDSGVPVDGISLSQSSMTLTKGDINVISASVSPEDAENRKISWSSSDSSICSVTQSGIVTGVNTGETSVLAVSDSSGKIAQCHITVVSPVTGISLSPSAVTMIRGAAEQLSATIYPSDATNKNILWASSNPSVCTVDGNGKISAVGTGKATITVMTKDGGYYAECPVTVIIPVTGITLDKTKLTLSKGSNDTLTATVWPNDASKPNVLWASSNPTVCSVEKDGHISAIGTGSAVISATTTDGGYVATCDVNVVVPVTGVTLNNTYLSLVKGTSKTLTATIFPSDATDKSVILSSSNNNVATVNSSGNVTAIGVGSTVITVTTHDGSFTAKCNVTVTVPVTGINLDKTRISLIPNATTKLTATINPDDATDKAVTWTSSNPELVTVDQKGNVKILGKTGSSTVTVTTHDGGYTASCTVLAMIHVKGIALDKTSMTIYKWNSSPLKVSFTPSDATDKAVTWSSSDTSVAAVSSSGSVYGRGYGKTTITATSHDGGYKTSCTVTVHGEIQAKVLRPSCYHHSFVNEDGSFSLYDEAGTGMHTLHSERAYDSLTLTFNHPISYTKGSSIAFFREIDVSIDRCDNDPYIAIYADNKRVATSGRMRNDETNVDCVATSSGSFNTLKIEVSGDFYLGNKDPTESPAPGSFNLEFPSGSLEVCGSTINNVEVIKK